MDHVKDYRPPKDAEDIDDITKLLREEGCAPKVPVSPASSEEEEVYAVPVKKAKKGQVITGKLKYVKQSKIHVYMVCLIKGNALLSYLQIYHYFFQRTKLKEETLMP